MKETIPKAIAVFLLLCAMLLLLFATFISLLKKASAHRLPLINESHDGLTGSQAHRPSGLQAHRLTGSQALRLTGSQALSFCPGAWGQEVARWGRGGARMSMAGSHGPGSSCGGMLGGLGTSQGSRQSMSGIQELGAGWA